MLQSIIYFTSKTKEEVVLFSKGKYQQKTQALRERREHLGWFEMLRRNKRSKLRNETFHVKSSVPLNSLSIELFWSINVILHIPNIKISKSFGKIRNKNSSKHQNKMKNERMIYVLNNLREFGTLDRLSLKSIYRQLVQH